MKPKAKEKESEKSRPKKFVKISYCFENLQMPIKTTDDKNNIVLFSFQRIIQISSLEIK